MADVKDRLERTAAHLAQAFGCTAKTEFLQDVPAVHNSPSWIAAVLPTLRRVAGADRVVQVEPTLGYDDISVFVNRYGGVYVELGVQDAEFAAGAIRPIPGGRGIAFNHNPGCYADDSVLVTGVRLHAYTTADHLTGVITAARTPLAI